MLVYLGWIAAAFMAGILFAEWMKGHRPSLQTRVEKAGYFRGKSYKEILREMNTPQTIIQQANGHTLRTWQEVWLFNDLSLIRLVYGTLDAESILNEYLSAAPTEKPVDSTDVGGL